MMRRRGTLAAVAACGALAVAGCGGDDEPEPQGATGATGAAGTEVVSFADWSTEAETICSDANVAIDEGAVETLPADTQPTEEELDQFVNEVVVPELQDSHDAIAALGAPEGNEAEAEELLAALQSGIEEIESEGAAAIGESGNALDEANRLAEKIGLRECGEG